MMSQEIKIKIASATPLKHYSLQDPRITVYRKSKNSPEALLNFINSCFHLRRLLPSMILLEQFLGKGGIMTFNMGKEFRNFVLKCSGCHMKIVVEHVRSSYRKELVRIYSFNF